jgi:ankyrin repeat protein
VKNWKNIRRAFAAAAASVTLGLFGGFEIGAHRDGWLMTAAASDYSALVPALAAIGPSQEAKDTALRYAVMDGDVGMTETLLKSGARDSGISLLWASTAGNVGIVRLLLDHGGNVNLFQGGPLLSAAGSGSTEVVRLLLERGADVHAQNDIARSAAVKEGHPEVVAMLDDAGRAIDGQPASPQTPKSKI